MGAYTTILSTLSGGVATVAFNRPEQHNTVNPTVIDELRDAMRALHRDLSVRVMVLTGEGRTFCPGTGPDWGAGDAPEMETSPILVDGDLPKLLYAAPFPTIAAVNGACAGVGLALAAACDLRIASDRAAFRSAFFSVGVAGDQGLPWLLSRLVGPAKAREISLLDPKINAGEALAIGLVNRVVPDQEFRSAVAELAAALAEGAPLAARTLKANYLAADTMSFNDFVDLEYQRHFHLLRSEDAAEGLAAFGERRTPKFKGR